jgi:hypothetical protein
LLNNTNLNAFRTRICLLEDFCKIDQNPEQNAAKELTKLSEQAAPDERLFAVFLLERRRYTASQVHEQRKRTHPNKHLINYK